LSSYVGSVLREPDGTVHTGSTLGGIVRIYAHDIRFVEKDPEHTKDFLRYCDPNPLAPSSIGIVILDQKENKIISYCPGTYLSFGFIHCMYIKHELNGELKETAESDYFIERNGRKIPVLGLNAFNTDTGDRCSMRLREFHEKGRVKAVSEWNVQDQAYTGNATDVSKASLAELAAIAKLDKGLNYAFALDLSPYEVTNIFTFADEIVIPKLKELGFEPDEKAWQEWAEYYK
jgi:hypothetical protein